MQKAILIVFIQDKIFVTKLENSPEIYQKIKLNVFWNSMGKFLL